MFYSYFLISTVITTNTPIPFKTADPSTISTYINRAGQGEFTLDPGSYFIDYEVSLSVYDSSSGTGSIDVATFVNNVAIVDTSTIAGSKSAGTWIHGRTFLIVTAPQTIGIVATFSDIKIGPVGYSDNYLSRLTISKVS